MTGHLRGGDVGGEATRGACMQHETIKLFDFIARRRSGTKLRCSLFTRHCAGSTESVRVESLIVLYGSHLDVLFAIPCVTLHEAGLVMCRK